MATTDKILDIVELSLLKLEKVHGEITGEIKYGNGVVATFKDGTKYKIGLPSLQSVEVTMEVTIQEPEPPKEEKTDIYGRARCRVIFVEKTPDIEEELIKFGYEKRSGSGIHPQNCIVIVPKKKWYWFATRDEQYRDSIIDHY